MTEATLSTDITIKEKRREIIIKAGTKVLVIHESYPAVIIEYEGERIPINVDKICTNT